MFQISLSITLSCLPASALAKSSHSSFFPCADKTLTSAGRLGDNGEANVGVGEHIGGLNLVPLLAGEGVDAER